MVGWLDIPDELGYILIGGIIEYFRDNSFLKSSEDYLKKTEKKSQYVSHSNICIILKKHRQSL